MKIIPFILLLTLAAGCHQRSMVGQLEEIDSLINHDHFNKAFVRIDEVDTASLNQEEYAHYNLLVAQRCCIKRQRDTTGLLDKIVIPYYLSTNNHEKLAEGYYYQAFGRLLSNQLSQAVVLYKKAEEQAAKTNNDRLHYKIAQSLSYVNEVCGNHLLQLNYAKQALAIALATGKEKWLAYSYTRVAMAHSELQHEDSAITYMRQALPYSRHMEKEDLPAFLNNVAFTFKNSQPDSAKKYLWESLALQEHSNTLQHLADIYYEEGRRDEAYRLWKRAIAVDNGTAKDIILYNLLEEDVKNGRMDSVCDMVSEIIQIKDSLLSQLMNDSIKDLQLHFDHETAMHRQETVTTYWKVGLIVTIILILLLTVLYNVRKKYIEKIKTQEVQMQINNYTNRIKELEATEEGACKEIEKLNKEIKKLLNNEAPKLKKGQLLYEHIKQNGTLSLWSKKDQKLFIDYYAAIDFRTVNRLIKTPRKEKLTTHMLFFLLLVEMRKRDEEIAHILGISVSSIRSLRSRTKPIE